MSNSFFFLQGVEVVVIMVEPQVMTVAMEIVLHLIQLVVVGVVVAAVAVVVVVDNKIQNTSVVCV